MQRLLMCVLVGGLASFAFAQDGQGNQSDKQGGDKPAETKEAASKDENKQPEKEDKGLKPHVKLETSMGDIVIELDGEQAPVTVQNFLDYVRSDFYDNTLFHRVIKGFMIQGGGFGVDKKQKQTRDPILNEWENELKNVRGTIAMARTSDPHSATAQFFINVADNRRLDQPLTKTGGAGYAVFGKVVEGMDVVDEIKAVEVGRDPELVAGGANVPTEPVVLREAEIVSAYDQERLEALAEAKEKKFRESKARAEDARKEARSRWEAYEKQPAEQRASAYEAAMDSGEYMGKSVQETDSGLKYVVLEEGSGTSPAPSDTVEVHYTGWLTSGKIFDSSLRRGSTIEFPLSGVIDGWTEGVAMMKEGGRRLLIIPYDLAYGERGRPPTIPPKSTLIFEIDLIDVK